MRKIFFTMLLALSAIATIAASCNLNDPLGAPPTATPANTPTPSDTPTKAPTATKTPAPTVTATPTAITGTVEQLVANPPFETENALDDRGRTVTVIKGFDVNEYGGSDADCKREGEPEMIHIGEVVGSETEPCLSVIEWSLKVGEETILAGTYALRPGEWFYIPLAVSGLNDSPRIVGTLYIMPRGWNAHMMAANYASDRDLRDGTTSYVGLSPTDPWVQAIADALLAGQ